LSVTAGRWLSGTALVTASHLTQNQIHHPTASYMLPWLSAVRENVGVSATGFLKSIGQDGHQVEVSVVVNGLGQFRDSAIVPGEDGLRYPRRGADGVAEDAT